jgi:hypothetical protein
MQEVRAASHRQPPPSPTSPGRRHAPRDEQVEGKDFTPTIFLSRFWSSKWQRHPGKKKNFSIPIFCSMSEHVKKIKLF